MTRLTVLLSILLWLMTPIPALAGPVTVFAAASLRGALEEVAAEQHLDLRLSYGGSGSMARQVAAGAPADVVILASQDWMDWLIAEGIVPQKARRDLLGNSLVLIAPAGQVPVGDPRDIAAMLGKGRLAMGHHAAVPAGKYAAQWLQHSGQWAGLRDRLAETDNVRAALALVARGQAPLGIVYATDARAEDGVEVVAELDPRGHDPITYAAAGLTAAGFGFLDALTSPGARTIFEQHGFAVTE
jgi:molybdate transport system substrate-binding protein